MFKRLPGSASPNETCANGPDAFLNRESPACSKSRAQDACLFFCQKWLFTSSSWRVNDQISRAIPFPNGIVLNWLVSSQPTELYPPFRPKPSDGSYGPTSSNRGGTTCGFRPKCPVISALHGRSRRWLSYIPVPWLKGKWFSALMKRPMSNLALALLPRLHLGQAFRSVWNTNTSAG